MGFKDDLDIAVTSAALPTSSVWQALVAEIDNGTHLHSKWITGLDLARDTVYHGTANLGLEPVEAIVDLGILFEDDTTDDLGDYVFYGGHPDREITGYFLNENAKPAPPGISPLSLEFWIMHLPSSQYDNVTDNPYGHIAFVYSATLYSDIIQAPIYGMVIRPGMATITKFRFITDSREDD